MKTKLSIFTAAIFSLAATVTGFAEPKDWIGKQLPALGVQFSGGTPDYKGKAAIVEFWATWCPPCRASIPHLNGINKNYQDKGLVVMGISDEKPDVVAKFRKSTPMEYHVATGGSAIQKKFGINGIPHAFVVGKDGKILWEGHPMELKDDVIEKALK